MTLPKAEKDPTWTLEDVKGLEEREIQFHSTPWDEVDFIQLAATADEIRANPYDLLLVLFRESFALPSAASTSVDKGKLYYGIVGMNQFTQEGWVGTFHPEMVIAPGTYKDPKATFKAWQEFAAEYVKMTPGEQLDYIAAYFKQTPTYKKGKRFVDAVQLYSANFGVGTSEITDPNHVFYKGPPLGGEPCFIWVKDADGKWSRVMTETGKKSEYNLYCQNEGMDVNGDRKITRSDLPGFLKKAIGTNALRWYALYYRLSRYLEGRSTNVVGPGF